MANWTTEDHWDILPNLNVQGHIKDGVLQWYELFPASGYVLHIPSMDSDVYDEWGMPTGEKQPYYSWGGATEFKTYDFAANPLNYHADLYEEGMIVYNTPTNQETI